MDPLTRAIPIPLLVAGFLAHGLLGCSRAPDPELIPVGDGWFCSLDVCERTCTSEGQLGEPCYRRSEAHCVTWLDGETGRGSAACAPTQRYCDELQQGLANGVLGARPARKVSRCAPTP